MLIRVDFRNLRNLLAKVVFDLATEDFIHFGLVDLPLHLGGHTLTSNKLKIIHSLCIERWLRLIVGARSLIMFIQGSLRDFLKEAYHFPSGHFCQLIVLESSSVKQSLLDAKFCQLAKVRIRACDLLWILYCRVYLRPRSLSFGHALICLYF